MCKDTKAEINAYNNLAVAFFNLADLKNSKYYLERGLNMVLEPADSRTRYIAIQDLQRGSKQRE